MCLTYILGLSIILQFAAALLALRLIPLSGGRKAWILISAGISLMAIRRCVTLFEIIQKDLHPDHYVTMASTEAWISLAISLMMFLGIVWIAPLFHSFKHSAEALSESEER